jgi:hypothetical protein
MPSARYQQRLDSWWQSQRDLGAEEDDLYEVGVRRIPFADSVVPQKPARLGLESAVNDKPSGAKFECLLVGEVPVWLINEPIEEPKAESAAVRAQRRWFKQSERPVDD